MSWMQRPPFCVGGGAVAAVEPACVVEGCVVPVLDAAVTRHIVTAACCAARVPSGVAASSASEPDNAASSVGGSSGAASCTVVALQRANLAGEEAGVRRAADELMAITPRSLLLWRPSAVPEEQRVATRRAGVWEQGSGSTRSSIRCVYESGWLSASGTLATLATERGSRAAAGGSRTAPRRVWGGSSSAASRAVVALQRANLAGEEADVRGAASSSAAAAASALAD